MYTPEQKRYFARELARSGGNVSAAVAVLRAEYESMRTVSRDTLHRFKREPDSAVMIAQEAELLSIADKECTLAREKARWKRQNTESERSSKDDAILDEVRKLTGQLVSKWNEEKSAKAFQQLIRLYERLTAIHDKRRALQLPVLASSEDSALLIRIVAQELRAALGRNSVKVIKKIRERFSNEAKMQLKNAPSEVKN